ncbi:MAG: DUF3617 domain-containing protein [Gammaproteobacteria bacterium]|nr:DUF3617 domain-containing protein [Gammaproteobacteria bacterium]
MIGTLSGRVAATAFLMFMVLAPVRADDPPGVLWETTSQMVMEGMPMQMPMQTQKMCAAREWTRPPPGGDRTCVTSNFKRVGNKATWTMQCSGDMPMTGTGEMTFEGTDSYKGAIIAMAEGMAMTIRLTGKKVGTCDKPMD